MKYTVVLRRSTFLMNIFDNENEFYVANPDTDFPDAEAAAKTARMEAAKADRPEVRSIMGERGLSVRGLDISSDEYEVVLVFEGQHKPLFGWQPALRGLNDMFGG